MARVVKEVVCDAVANRLGDPRIEGFISVTRVDMTPDLRNANVYLSLFGSSDIAQNKTFAAITHAKNRIRALLAGRLRSKFCPVLNFFKDEDFKKTLETMKLIDQAINELKKKDSVDQQKD